MLLLTGWEFFLSGKASYFSSSKRVLFLPPSDAYVRSFFYLLYTLIKLYYTKALSDQASSLAPDRILLLRGPRIPVYSRDSTTTFHFYKQEASSFALSPISTLLITEMAASPSVSWDLILWRGKREDLRDLTELSGCMRDSAEMGPPGRHLEVEETGMDTYTMWSKLL